MKLFKYLHPDRIDVLENRCIRFSSPAALNDPFELKPHLTELASEHRIKDMIPEVVEALLKKIPSEQRRRVPKYLLDSLINKEIEAFKGLIRDKTNELLPIVRKAMSSAFERGLGILCLTESPDNLLMWAHYADSHRGFVIEFDGASNFFQQRLGENDDLRHIRKVIYSQKRPSLSILDLESFSPFVTKSEEWSYEREWRMMLPLSYANRVLCEDFDPIHLFNIPEKSIRSLIFGSRISPTLKEKILQTLAASPEFSHVKCYQAETDEIKFSLNIEPYGEPNGMLNKP